MVYILGVLILKNICWRNRCSISFTNVYCKNSYTVFLEYFPYNLNSFNFLFRYRYVLNDVVLSVLWLEICKLNYPHSFVAWRISHTYTYRKIIIVFLIVTVVFLNSQIVPFVQFSHSIIWYSYSYFQIYCVY